MAENGEVHNASSTESRRNPYARPGGEVVAVGYLRWTLDALGTSGRQHGPHPMAGEFRAPD